MTFGSYSIKSTFDFTCSKANEVNVEKNTIKNKKNFIILCIQNLRGRKDIFLKNINNTHKNNLTCFRSFSG